MLLTLSLTPRLDKVLIEARVIKACPLRLPCMKDDWIQSLTLESKSLSMYGPVSKIATDKKGLR